ncbi:unnamed protein product, partial [Musa textilis]
PCGPVGAEVGDAELASAEHLPQLVPAADVAPGKVPEDDKAGDRPTVVVDREGVRPSQLSLPSRLPLPLLNGRRRTAVAHWNSGCTATKIRSCLQGPT